MFTRIPFCIVPALFAVYIPMCTPKVQPTAAPWDAHMAELWQKPLDLPERDLFYGPWGVERAPDPHATYTFVAKKQHGTNPGVIVTDPEGREWHVKQPPNNHQGAEGPIEVVLSRVLSAAGYAPAISIKGCRIGLSSLRCRAGMKWTASYLGCMRSPPTPRPLRPSMSVRDIPSQWQGSG